MKFNYKKPREFFVIYLQDLCGFLFKRFESIGNALSFTLFKYLDFFFIL